MWRDFVPSRQLLLQDAAGLAPRVLSSESSLQQEVYVWQTREDPFSGIADDAARHDLRDLLVERFAAAKPPSARRFPAIDAFLDRAQRLLDSGGAEWTVSQDAADDEDQPARLNTLLALKNHIEWLRSVFSEQPGVSVLVR